MTAKPTVLVTSAGGAQAGHLIPHLIQNYNLRLVAFSEASVNRLKSTHSGASVEVIQADFTEPSQCRSALSGVTAIYHIGPSLHNHETEIGFNLIDAAVYESQQPGSSFQHFVFSSVLNTQLRKLMNHDCKRYVEEYIMESPLKYTILQPSDFLDLPFQLARFQGEDPVYHAHIPPHIQSSMTCLDDLSEAAAKVIREGPQHYFAQYPLASTTPIAYGDCVKLLSKTIGKEVKIKHYSVEDAATLLMTIVFGKHDASVLRRERDRAERLTMFYSRRGLQGNPNVMRWLLGREPTSAEQWFEKQAQKAQLKGAGQQKVGGLQFHPDGV